MRAGAERNDDDGKHEENQWKNWISTKDFRSKQEQQQSSSSCFGKH
jgi:hypothetical protein